MSLFNGDADKDYVYYRQQPNVKPPIWTYLLQYSEPGSAVGSRIYDPQKNTETESQFAPFSPSSTIQIITDKLSSMARNTSRITFGQ